MGIFTLAFVGTTLTGSGTARACSCDVPDLVASVLDASVIVSGETIESVDLSPGEQEIDRRFLFRVDQRYRGDTPDVIEVRVDTTLGNCDDTVQSLWSVLMLGPPTAQGWYAYPVCSRGVLEHQLAPLFDQVWPLTGSGSPGAVAAVATRDHDLVVLDGVGLPLWYLPGPGPTLGLATCPGGAAFIQLRRTSWNGGPVELAVWDTSSWTEVGTVPIETIQLGADGAYPSVPLTCIAPDGSTSMVRWDGGYDVVGSAVTPRDVDDGVLAPYPGGAALLDTGGALAVQPAEQGAEIIPVANPDPAWFPPEAIEVTATGWRVSRIENRWPSKNAIVATDIALDGSATQVSTTPIDLPLFGWAAVPLDAALVGGAPSHAATTPRPLLDRSGVRIEAPAPMLPVVSVVPSTSPVVTPTATTVGAAAGDDGNDSSGGFLWVGVGAVTVAGLAIVVLRRRRTTPAP